MLLAVLADLVETIVRGDRSWRPFILSALVTVGFFAAFVAVWRW